MMLDKCARCGVDLLAWSMSYFNTDEICLDCVQDERKLPSYEVARQHEVAQVKAGNWNFNGVGLTQEDRRLLAQMRKERK